MKDERLFMEAKNYEKLIAGLTDAELKAEKKDLQELLKLCTKNIPIQQSSLNSKGGANYAYSLAYTKKVKAATEEKLAQITAEEERRQQIQK